MEYIKIYSRADIASKINKRAGETKFGEDLQFVKKLNELSSHPAHYVLLGIPEDIGVRANYGKAGTSEAWDAALGALVNIQATELLSGRNVILLGEIDCDKQMEQANQINSGHAHFAERLGELVIQIDHKVSTVVKEIILAGKFPIIVGGGHNNSYGNIKGTAQAVGAKINCINLDAHTDFRALEHRHSGNGFSYAYEEGFLERYFVLGLHRNYTSQPIFENIERKKENIKFNLFEDIILTSHYTLQKAMDEAGSFCCHQNFGIEVDLDAISLMGSSAMSPTGFSVGEVRQFVHNFSKMATARYVHLCEGAPEAGVFPNQVAKTLAYLISDIISDL